MNLYERKPDDGGKKIKTVIAVVYLLLMAFLVGGSYINQHRADAGDVQLNPTSSQK